MPRSPLPLALVLACLAGCGDAVDAEPPTPSPAAPLRSDIRLVAARNARPWQPPAVGDAPVVEVLRDGSWVLDGTPLEATADGDHADDARRRLLDWLAEHAARMTKHPVRPDHPRSPLVPATALVLRADRDAPWRAIRTVLWACRLPGIEIFQIDVAVEPERRGQTAVLRLPLCKDIGLSNYGSGEFATRVVLLEQGAEPLNAPCIVAFAASRTDEDRERPELEELELSDAAGFMGALTDLEGWHEAGPWPLFPEDAPWWSALAALELAMEAGLDDFEVPFEPLEQHLAALRSGVAAARAGGR